MSPRHRIPDSSNGETLLLREVYAFHSTPAELQIKVNPKTQKVKAAFAERGTSDGAGGFVGDVDGWRRRRVQSRRETASTDVIEVVSQAERDK